MADRSQTPAPVVVGMVLLQRWRLDGLLGTGGMAEVFRATDLHTGRGVAVKILRGSLESSPEAIQRFRREGELLVRLKNPAIVGADSIEALPDGRLYIVMELLEGETLGARLKRGPMSASELGPVVAGCAAALAAAHAAGIVHRDLKPDNVFLVRRADGTLQVKLLDFGVSKVFNGEKLTQTGQVLGTPRYMSPEQLGAEPEVDHRVDLYSLGVILYEALSGRSPFLASTPTDLIVAILHGKTVPLRSVRPDVPPALEAVVMRAMAKLRDARHRAATELAEAFFDAAGIDARVRPAQRHGMATTPLGAMRAAADGSPLEELVASAPSDAGSGALKLGTFSSFEAIDMDRVLSAGSTAPAPALVGAHVGATTAPGPSEGERAAVAVAATAYAPGGLANVGPTVAVQPPPARREIPMTALSPVMPGIEATPEVMAQQRPRGDASSSTSRRDPSGAQPHDAYPGRISRSSSASIAGAHAPRAAASDGPQPSQGLLLVGVGLLAGGLTAGVVVAVLTWVTQMSSGGARTPPPPPPAALSDAALSTDAGVGAGATAAGVVLPGAAGSTAAGTGSGTTGATVATATGSTTPAAGSTGAGSAASAAAAGSTPGSPGAASASSGGGPSAGASSSGTTGGSASSGGPSAGASGSGGATGGGSASSGSGGSGGSRPSGSSGSGGSRPSGSSGSSGGDSHGAEASDEAASSAATTLREASSALARGDYAECVDILDDVIARGGTPVALRRRGDCLMRMGEVREATRDYQRFCRLAPDHPAISEVRGILAGMGATCP